MKFKQFLARLSDINGFIPTGHLRWFIRQNPRTTAREEAIAAEVIRQANPRENITGVYPCGPEQSLVLQQLWIKPDKTKQWRDVPIAEAHNLFETHQTKHGPLPVPNALSGPESVPADFHARINEILGNDYYEDNE